VIADDPKIVVAKARLEAAIAAHELARRPDNSLRTPVIKLARGKAVVQMTLASHRLAELMEKGEGL
jgi:hypothetical protein